MVFQEADLSIRVLRDVLVEEFEGAIIDDAKQHDRVTNFLQRTAPELVDRVELYKGKKPLLEEWDVESAFDSVLSRRVDLPSGGYLMIDYAEALTVIDINTGSFTGRGKGRLEDTITKVNVEAAEEVVRQLRMRDIGGIIVIDFIDMARARNRDQVLKTLRTALDEDKTKTYVIEVSPLGLVEMTRQNVTDGVREILTKRCPTCDGEGVVASEETVAISIVRKLQDVVEEDPKPEAFLIRVNPRVAAELLDARLGRSRSSRRRPASTSTSRAATPCRSTPSRWSRRAPARRSSSAPCRSRSARRSWSRSRSPTCTTSTTRSRGSTPTSSASPAAGPHVGERRLVRIESVGRSAATAALLDSDGNVVKAGANGDGSERLESVGLRRAPASRQQGRQATLSRRRQQRARNSRGQET